MFRCPSHKCCHLEISVTPISFILLTMENISACSQEQFLLPLILSCYKENNNKSVLEEAISYIVKWQAFLYMFLIYKK